MTKEIRLTCKKGICNIRLINFKMKYVRTFKKIEDPHRSGKKRFYILFSQRFSAPKTTFNGNIFIIYCFCKYSKMKRLNIACSLSKIHSPDKTK